MKELLAALEPFKEEYFQWLHDHPEEHRRQRMAAILVAAEGLACEALTAHFTCFIHTNHFARHLYWVAEHRPEVFESIYPAFKQIFREHGLFPTLDWDRAETYEAYALSEMRPDPEEEKPNDSE